MLNSCTAIIGCERWLAVLSAVLLLTASCSRGPSVKEQPVLYDLVDEFESADRFWERDVLDFGSSQVQAALLEGWSHRGVSTEKGTTFRWGLGEKSALQIYAGTPREMTLTLRCRPFLFPGAPEQEVTLGMNGQAFDRIVLRPEWAGYTVTVPRQRVTPGENRLEFHYSYAEAPAQVLKGNPDRRRLAVAWDFLRVEGLPQGDSHPERDASSRTVYLPFGSEVSYYVRLPREAVLSVGKVTASAGASGSLHLTVERSGGQETEQHVLASHGREPLAAGEDGEVVRLRLRAAPDGDSAWTGDLAVREPKIHDLTAPVGAVSQRSLQPPKPSPSGDPPNVIIYLVDTLRADVLGCYGNEPSPSPNIDAFAEEAVLFERGLAQSSWTRSSVASLFTGLLPTAHGANRREDSLPPEAFTMAEILQSGGYETAAFITNPNVDSTFGFSQGFDLFTNLGDRPGPRLPCLSDQVNQEVVQWLSDRELDRPFFLYIHTIDPHAPYAPPEPYRQQYTRHIERPKVTDQMKESFRTIRGQLSERFSPEMMSDKVGSLVWIHALARRSLPPTPLLREWMEALYTAEVAFNDHSFGAFLQELRKRQLFGDSLIVFLSDHGEEFYEHGSWAHGNTLYSEVIDTPLIVKFPSSYGLEGERLAPLAQHVDILPTVLDVAQLAVDESFEGHSLLNAFRPRSAGNWSAGVSYLDLDRRNYMSVSEHPWRLITQPKKPERFELYDHRTDPEEQQNVADRHPLVLRYLLGRLKAQQPSQDNRLPSKQANPDQELIDRLEALGYIQ